MTSPPRADTVNWNEIISTPGPPDYTQGPQGEPGPPGPAGPIGPPGEDGAEGIQGDDGTTGPGWKVMTRPPNTGEVSGDALGTIWYSAPTGQFWTLIDNTSPAWVWRLDGTVVGAQGVPGTQGPAGPQGPPGATGNDGPQGATGLQGPVGATGPQGPPGTPGATGAQGATGPQGATGATGATGAAGPVGPSSSVHEEFLPTNGATTVTLSQTPNWILMLARAGVVQSQAGGNYSLAGSTITFTDALNGAERVIVDYASTGYTPVPPLDGAGINPNSITTTQIQDGTIVAADIANATITNAKLASDTARRNLFTNGGFEIWQRGNGPFTANGAYAMDRWSLGLVGTDTISVSRDTANADTSLGSVACAAVTFTLGTGAGVSNIGQLLRPSEWPLANLTISVSVRVRTATPNAVRIGLYSGAAWTYSGFHTGGGTYQTLTVTTTVPAAPSVQLSIFFAASCTAYLDNAMLVTGAVPADYAPLHPADDMARCQRYWQRHNVNIRWMAVTTGATQEFTVPLRSVMAVTPTVTLQPGSRTNLNTSGYPSSRFATAETVCYSYLPAGGTPAAPLDTFALGDVYAVEANP